MRATYSAPAPRLSRPPDVVYDAQPHNHAIADACSSQLTCGSQARHLLSLFLSGRGAAGLSSQRSPLQLSILSSPSPFLWLKKEEQTRGAQHEGSVGCERERGGGGFTRELDAKKKEACVEAALMSFFQHQHLEVPRWCM